MEQTCAQFPLGMRTFGATWAAEFSSVAVHFGDGIKCVMQCTVWHSNNDRKGILLGFSVGSYAATKEDLLLTFDACGQLKSYVHKGRNSHPRSLIPHFVGISKRSVECNFLMVSRKDEAACFFPKHSYRNLCKNKHFLLFHLHSLLIYLIFVVSCCEGGLKKW